MVYVKDREHKTETEVGDLLYTHFQAGKVNART